MLFLYFVLYQICGPFTLYIYPPAKQFMRLCAFVCYCKRATPTSDACANCAPSHATHIFHRYAQDYSCTWTNNELHNFHQFGNEQSVVNSSDDLIRQTPAPISQYEWFPYSYAIHPFYCLVGLHICKCCGLGFSHTSGHQRPM